MRKLHHLLDTQSTLVVHPLMGLYIALPCTTHIPLINGPWKTLLRQRELFWSFLGDQVEVRSDQVMFLSFLYRITSVVSQRVAMKIISHFHILKRCEGEKKTESIWDHSGYFTHHFLNEFLLHFSYSLEMSFQLLYPNFSFQISN